MPVAGNANAQAGSAGTANIAQRESAEKAALSLEKGA
jgi:hypothetical protein